MSEWSQALSAHPAATDADPVPTISGNRGLQIEEKLIFEQDSPGHCGVDLPEPPAFRPAASIRTTRSSPIFSSSPRPRPIPSTTSRPSRPSSKEP